MIVMDGKYENSLRMSALFYTGNHAATERQLDCSFLSNGIGSDF